MPQLGGKERETENEDEKDGKGGAVAVVATLMVAGVMMMGSDWDLKGEERRRGRGRR